MSVQPDEITAAMRRWMTFTLMRAIEAPRPAEGCPLCSGRGTFHPCVAPGFCTVSDGDTECPHPTDAEIADYRLIQARGVAAIAQHRLTHDNARRAATIRTLAEGYWFVCPRCLSELTVTDEGPSKCPCNQPGPKNSDALLIQRSAPGAPFPKDDPVFMAVLRKHFEATLPGLRARGPDLELCLLCATMSPRGSTACVSCGRTFEQ